MTPRKLKISPKTLEEIQRTLKSELPILQKKYRVKSLGIFGSYVRRANKAGSDLDLLVEFDQAPTMFEFVRLERQLTAMLGIKVDLVMKSALKPEIGKHILAEVMPV